MSISRFVIFAGLLSFCAATAHANKVEPPLVFLPGGGVIAGSASANGSEAFKGMRYAEPPTGINRFQPAEFQALDPTQSFSALDFGPECLQLHKDDPKGPVRSEDCLFLNVYRPKGTTNTSALDTMVWIHGGGMATGSGSARWFDGGHLASTQKVVLITLNYRLGERVLSADPSNFSPALALLHCPRNHQDRWASCQCATARILLAAAVQMVSWTRSPLSSG